MNAKVTLHSDGPGAALQTITIEETGADTAHIERMSGPGFTQSEYVRNVRADPVALTLTCQLDAFLVTGDISVVVQRGAANRAPLAVITLSHAIAGNGSYNLSLREGDDDAVKIFLQKAAFSPLVG